MAGTTPDDQDEDAGQPPTAPPPWIRRDRRPFRFVVRIGVSVAIGVAVAALGPTAYALRTAPDTAAIAAVPPAQWPECPHLTPNADACWYRVSNRAALTVSDAAAMLNVSVERLQVMNPQWTSVGTAPQRIIVWRGDITGGGQ